jgi:hypothetical protein
MPEQQEKRLLQVFPRPEWMTSAGCGPAGNGGGCACCGGGCAPAGTTSTERLEALLADFEAQHPGQLQVEMADYSSDEATGRAVDALNEVLERSDEKVRATKQNLFMLISRAAPLLAIDGVLTFLGGVPTVEQLVEALAEADAPAA